jgi:hypothetical protein
MLRKRNSWTSWCLLAWFCLVSAPLSYAAEIEGVTFADRYQAGEITLVLNGVGLLRYRIFIKAQLLKSSS